MKTNSTQTDGLFLDRPLPEAPRPTRRYSSLYATGLDRNDRVDSILRVLLAFSVLGSLALFGWESSLPTAKAVAQRTAAPAALVCTIGSHAKPAAL